MRTALQRELTGTFGALGGARERLDDLSYIAYVAIVLERVIGESARLSFGEALRALRNQGEDR